VLLDPFEKQFHLPATLVKRGDNRWWQDSVVGQKDKCLACLRILEFDTPQMLGIILRYVKALVSGLIGYWQREGQYWCGLQSK
jgi:hypothetical protein